MEKIILSNAKVEGEIILRLTEQEARALLNITVYGHKYFTEWFYKHLGKHYLQPHEKGLISLFDVIQKELPKHLDKIKQAREIFY